MRQSFFNLTLRLGSSLNWMGSVRNRSCVGFLFLLMAKVAITQTVLAQGSYPTTQYSGIGGESFSTSKPLQADSPGQNSYREMSPDSWAPQDGVMRITSPQRLASTFQVNGGTFAPSQSPNSASGKVIRNQFIPDGTEQGSVSESAGANSSQQAFSKLPSSQRKINPFEQASRSSGSGEISILDSLSHSESFSPTPSQLGRSAVDEKSADYDLSIAPPSIPADIRKPFTGTPVATQGKPVPSQLPSSNLSPSDNSFPFLNPPANVSPNINAPANSIIRTPVNSSSSAAPIENPFDPNWAFGGSPNFRSDLGYRDAQPTIRNYGSPDHHGSFAFEEKKKEYPPMSEILATGSYFGSASMLLLRPSFQSNTAISESVSGTSTTFDFDYETAPQFQIGFESAYGPGIELNYWQYDESSNPATFTSNGIETGTTTVWGMAPNLTSSLVAANNAETLNAVHTLDIESFGASFFKFVQMPVSRINGKFGWQYVSIAHDMSAQLTNGVGNQIGFLNSRSDMRATGPTFKLEYFRPVGHTKLELTTGFGGSVLFGRQDHFVSNSSTGSFQREGADEILTALDFNAGVQYRKMIGANRYLFAQTGLIWQNWLGGGNALLPSEDFGLRGFTFSVGYNH